MHNVTSHGVSVNLTEDLLMIVDELVSSINRIESVVDRALGPTQDTNPVNLSKDVPSGMLHELKIRMQSVGKRASTLADRVSIL